VRVAEKLELAVLADNEEFHLLCRELAGTNSDIVQTRARFLSQLQSDDVAHYVASGSPKRTAAQSAPPGLTWLPCVSAICKLLQVHRTE